MTDMPEVTPEVTEDNPAEVAPKGNREAKYRTERNDARAERDALAARIAAYQSRELENTAGKHLSAPADLLTLSGKTLADFLTEDGSVDTEAVNAAALEIVQMRPGIGIRQRATDVTQGAGNNAPAKRLPTWGSLAYGPDFDGGDTPPGMYGVFDA